MFILFSVIYSCPCVYIVVKAIFLSWCLDCSRGQSQVSEATGATRPVPGARQHPGICTQTGACRRANEESNATFLYLHVNPRGH